MNFEEELISDEELEAAGQKFLKKVMDLKNRGVSYVTLGKILNLNKVTISRWVHGKCRPYFRKIEDLEKRIDQWNEKNGGKTFHVRQKSLRR